MKKKIAVIGLGILGVSLAKFLTERGAEVIAIDSDMNRVEEIKDYVTVAVNLNATNERALRSQDLEHVDQAVVCIGENFQANLLTTVLLKKIGVKYVVTRASNPIERQILKEVGADELVYPEEDLARELAVRLTAESLLDMIPLSPSLGAAKVKAPKVMWGKALMDLKLRKAYGINIIAIYEEDFDEEEENVDPFPTPETVIRKGQILLIIGKRNDIEKFAKL